MRRITILLTAGLGWAWAATAMGGEPVRPMSEMHGDCANFLTDVTRDMALWAQPATAIAASATSGAAASAPLEKRLRIALKPHPDVRFAAAPEQMRGAPDTFSGLVAITTGAAGAYRLSASNGLWLDVVGPAGLIPSRTFEMQTKCDRIFKTVTYDLPANARLIVQLNGAAAPTVDLLVHRVAP